MFQIIKEKSKYHAYAFVFPFSFGLLEYCRKLKTTYGWRNFMFNTGRWRFNDLGFAVLIKKEFPDTQFTPEVEVLVEEYKQRKANEQAVAQSAQVIKTKKESGIRIDGLKLPLYEYQKIGVEFFVNNNGRALLADSPGCGKSAQALGYVVHEKIKKTLIVCPASVKYSWHSEVLKWTHLKPAVLSSKNKDAEVIQAIVENDVVVINYDILNKFIKILSSLEFSLMILDESHYCKTPTSIRTKNVKKIAERVPKILLLSGTPMLSRPVELFTSLQLVDPHNWTDWRAYTERYCGGFMDRWGWNTRGATNIPELTQKISHYFIRRTKDDVLSELPKKQYVNRFVDLDNDTRFKYDLALDSFEDYLREYKKKSEAQIESSMAAEKIVKLNELREITTLAKLDYAKEIIDEIIDGGEKLLVFSCYNAPLEKLNEHYGASSYLLTGKTDEELRRIMIEKFQNDPSKKIFFGGIKSAGVGITLTAASSVLFLDYSWTPADHIQASDRVHRPGQTAKSVTIYQLVANDTIDSQMNEILTEKHAIITQVIDNGVSLESELFNKVFAKIQSKV